MKNFPFCCKDRKLRFQASVFLRRSAFVLFLAVCPAPARQAYCQVVPSATSGEWLSAGGMFSASHLSYGSRNLLGGTAFIDMNLTHRWGGEAETTWLFLHQRENVHDETYLIGPRFNFNDIGRWRPYAKLLIGNGQFNFPFDFAHGGYLVIAPGGGVGYRITRNITFRAADIEYQVWPQFTFGTLSSIGINSGIQYRIR